MITVEYPCRLVSVANAREHWSRRAARAKAHREAALCYLLGRGKVAGPATVTITRIGAKMLDTDNLASACKATRDGVADWLGRDDADPSITWGYAQELAGKRGVYAVRIEVQSVA